MCNIELANGSVKNGNKIVLGYTPNYANVTVISKDATIGANGKGTGKVAITAEDETTQKTYTVNFTIGKPDAAQLDAAIAAANGAKSGIETSNLAASAVEKGKKFVTTAEMDALNNAISAGVAAKASATSMEAIAAATKAVKDTVAAFKAAIKTGSYVAPVKPENGGWVDFGGGQWCYKHTDGSWAYGWAQIGGAWYHLNTGGYMSTGWLQDGANWFYLHGSGQMATGTATVDGAQHNFAANGVWQGAA